MDELSVITKCYDLILWLIVKLDKFPKTRKFGLGDRMETLLLDILEGLIEAKYSRAKVQHLTAVNLRLEKLRYLIRLAKDLKCLSIREYEHASRLMLDLGNEVGGWLRQQKGKGR